MIGFCWGDWLFGFGGTFDHVIYVCPEKTQLGFLVTLSQQISFL